MWTSLPSWTLPSRLPRRHFETRWGLNASLMRECSNLLWKLDELTERDVDELVAFFEGGLLALGHY